jgi:hypothetical protein
MTHLRRSPEERRRARRQPFVAAVRQEGAAGVALALAQNLGEEGMELRCVAGAGVRAPVSLAFELPDGGALVEVRGAVVWARAEGRFETAGVRFSGLSPRDHDRIVRFLDGKA